jgi:ABC-type transport system substrate-binding protein
VRHHEQGNTPLEPGPYFGIIENPGNAAQWDISEPGWAPDWLGNNGRSNVVPLFQTSCVNPTSNFGCYSSSTTDSLIKQALSAPSASAAAPLWTKAGEQVMKDAVIVPMTTQHVVLFAGWKVHNLIYSPIAEQYNPTQLWVSRQ